MADRKKNRRRFDEDEPPTKEDYAIAKYLRFNTPTKEGKLHSMEVRCFYASAAVDALLKSKWSSSKNSKDPIFFNRSSCVNYCHRLLAKGMFHRAEKVQRKKEKGEKTKKKKGKEVTEKEEVGTGDELRERKGKKDKKGKKEKEEAVPEKEKEGEEKKEEKEEKKEEKKDDGKKKKEKRLKLVMTDDQRFLDGEDNVYVWIYDPVNAKTLLIGSLIVLGAIALCLFPLWPEVVRIGVYYVSLAAAGFVGFILSLVVLRLILFCLIWVITIGRHHFWLLPNLTEDVGFFESFRPLYKHDNMSKDSSSTDASKNKDKSKSIKKADAKSKKKEKSSDKEDTGSEQEEFEMIDRGDVEEEGEEGGGEEGGDRMEGEEDTEDNGEGNEEEEEYGQEEEYDENNQNGAADEEEDEDEEEEDEEEEDSQSRKDK